MFEILQPPPTDLRGLSDAELSSRIADCARLAAAAEAAKSVAIAELVRRRCVDEHPDWACDDWDACAAELACVLTVSQRAASSQMQLAIALRDRLPKVAALFLDGRVSARIVGTIAWRTHLVVDADALDAIDSDIAESVKRWGRLSQKRVEQAVDATVARWDPAAVHRVRTGMRGRDFTIGDADDATGTTSVWGKLSNADAALLHEAVTALVKSVCPDDPRTLAQRRADAFGALAVRATSLPCRCGNSDCAAATGDDPVATRFVIYVLADPDAVEGSSEPDFDGGRDFESHDVENAAPASEPAESEPRSAGSTTPPAESDGPRGIGLIPGMPGTGLLDGIQVADLIARGARVRPLNTPGDDREPGYRPSTVLDRWIRLRDLTCRHPGCDQPAVHADIDHTVPWPTGPTHPSNTSCRCRKHHLVKTFWPGWSDRQEPDGQVHITTPSGQTYTTKPTALLLFPRWNTTTTRLSAVPKGHPPAPARGLKMPKRKQTRANARAQRIAAARALNDTEGRFPTAADSAAPQ